MGSLVDTSFWQYETLPHVDSKSFRQASSACQVFIISPITIVNAVQAFVLRNSHSRCSVHCRVVSLVWSGSTFWFVGVAPFSNGAHKPEWRARPNYWFNPAMRWAPTLDVLNADPWCCAALLVISWHYFLSLPNLIQPTCVLCPLTLLCTTRPSAALGPHKLGHKKEPQLPAEKGLQLLLIITAPTSLTLMWNERLTDWMNESINCYCIALSFLPS